jgi:tetratricopeptide (TPR) repeat protein
MNRWKRLGFLSMPILLVGCTAFQTSTELHKGRVALLGGMPDAAVTHFTQVTALNDKARYSQLQEGAWTYLGRAYYDAKKYPQARQALERAVAINGDDSFARLYLGLTLARQGDYDTGRREVLLGLQGLYDSLDYIAYNTSTGMYWDATGQIRAALGATKSDVQVANPNLDPLFAHLETLGITIEQEIDAASRDESRERNRRAGGGDD